MTAFITRELDGVALAQNTFTDRALGLIVRSREGVLGTARNLCLGALSEAVRDRTLLCRWARKAATVVGS